MNLPKISVVIPSFNRYNEIQKCLEGFALQTISSDYFEIIIIDDGSEDDLRGLLPLYQDHLMVRIERRVHRGVSEARNEGIELATAPFIILGEDDLRPLPSMVEYCLDFHKNYPNESDVVLLYFTTDWTLNRNLLIHFLVDHIGIFFGFPKESGIYDSTFFWGGTISCKKSLFQYGKYDSQFPVTEDSELGARINKQCELQIHFEPLPQATFIRDITLKDIQRRQYLMDFYRFSHPQKEPTIRDLPGIAHWYAHPDEYIITSSQDYDYLIKTITELEGKLKSVNPRFASGRVGERVAVLYRMYASAIAHAAASGFRDAQNYQIPQLSDTTLIEKRAFA